ncbi:zinc-ribbon domain-containing protein [Carnobacterium inhibens]|uniref:zinc-ribbon domain-containing protein n=1 Tax=Carnobacterium inhibens TaxID=147709 RepID=UPI00203B772F|nr:zinc-ribbon domain-containing protein [Carnobacterium inhibens]MCM3513440.1 zinc-ribbon domain-containing protein [Carnobacterium inhibens]
MGKLRAKLQKFMIGRYGVDKLSNYLLYGGLIILVLANLFHWSIIGLLGWAAILFGYYRAFSRNRTNRYQENQKFLTFTRQLTRSWNQKRNKFLQRKVYKYYACPKCHKKLRVPRNKGKITITCPHCREKFIKKT